MTKKIYKIIRYNSNGKFWPHLCSRGKRKILLQKTVNTMVSDDFLSLIPTKYQVPAKNMNR